MCGTEFQPPQACAFPAVRYVGCTVQVEKDINQAVHDLTAVVTSLNMAQTATLREELLQKMAAMEATGMTSDAQQADLNVCIHGWQLLLCCGTSHLRFCWISQ